MRFALRLAAVLLLLLPLAARAQRSPRELARRIDALLDQEAFRNAFWGVVVADLRTGRTLYARFPEKSFVPASNAKLYTTAAALDLLGPAFRYRTEVYVDGPVEGGTLHGNLIVRGSGDPTLGAGRFNENDLTRPFRQWADSLRAHGVARIAGDLVGDDDVFDDVPLGYGWAWDDEPFWYSAELGGLVFNDNNVDYSIRARRPGEPADVTWEPFNTDYVRVVNATRTLPADSSLVEGYARERGTNTVRLTSLVPEGRTDVESLTITNPTLFFTHVLREALLRAGVPVLGRAVDVDALPFKPAYGPGRALRVATHLSPTLAEIVNVVNKRSQNLYADQLLKTLGTLASVPPGAPPAAGSHPGGVERAREVFARAGVDTSRIQLVDGSGLSRLNLVTPEMTVRLLRYMGNHPDPAVRRAFVESLPIGGVDGTLQNRFTSGPARGNVRAKTGFVGNVRTLSGYVTSSAGTPLVFSIMCNHYTVQTRLVNETQDALVDLLARYRR